MTKFVPEEAFDQETAEGFWIADFMTDHCGPCKMLDMVLAEIIYDNPEINLQSVISKRALLIPIVLESRQHPRSCSSWTVRSSPPSAARSPGKYWNP